ncbi:MAG: hypothetical protein SWE60_07710 [Thermodesulfobacteriota bacterium]|nr:hypothetical protein [Thermodesulfobacteriota bacterium]
MRKRKFLAILVILFGALLCSSPSAFAEGVIIQGGSTLTLNDGTLHLGCRDLTVEALGTLDLGTGSVRECGHLLVNAGGQLIRGTGTIGYCGVIPWFPLLLLDEDQGGRRRR